MPPNENSDPLGASSTNRASAPRPSAESSASNLQIRKLTGNVGGLIRGWRMVRRLTQLDLALEADTSSRHLSFIETGRAQPSREMVLRLAESLDVPLRERNALLLAAGFAPHFRRTSLDMPEMEDARRAMELILGQQEPFPAIVIDRYWNIVMANNGTRHFLALFPECASDLRENSIRLVFHPRGLRPYIENWEPVAAHIIQRVHRAVIANPSDDAMRVFLSELLAYPDVPSRWQMVDVERSPAPLLTINYGRGVGPLRLFATITTFATAQDIALQELRIECFFPADQATREAFSAL
jgi:transcriptional regulator with XRE-family HTH domain